jgi:tRNA uridine 5-carbamoylmethylation protein Kti12
MYRHYQSPRTCTTGSPSVAAVSTTATTATTSTTTFTSAYQNQECRTCSIVVLVVCGLPGCGKSTLVHALQEHYCSDGGQQQHPSITRTNQTSTAIVQVVVHSIVYDDIQHDIALQLREQQQRQQEQEQQHHCTLAAVSLHLQEKGNDIEITCVDNTADTGVTDLNIIKRNGSDADKCSRSTADIPLQAWRQSRKVALGQLRQLLVDITIRRIPCETQTGSPGSADTMDDENTHHSDHHYHQHHIILLDDNFYLRSMRKQIYRTCVDHVQQSQPQQHEESRCNSPEEDEFWTLWFGMIYIDTPVSLCLERNAQRRAQQQQHQNNVGATNMIVTDQTIEQMQERFEIPTVSITKGYAPWEKAVLTITTSNTPSIQEQVQVVQESLAIPNVHENTFLYPIIPISNDDDDDDDDDDDESNISNDDDDNDRNSCSYSSTLTEQKRQADLFWRHCVSMTARHVRTKVQISNQVRKYCLSQYQTQPQRDAVPSLSSALTKDVPHDMQNTTSMECMKLQWYNMFVQGIPLSSSSTTTTTRNDTESMAGPLLLSSSWLTYKEEEILRQTILPNLQLPS